MNRKLYSLLIIFFSLLWADLFAYNYSQIPGVETYPRANSVIALSEHRYALNDDGSYTTYIHIIRKILNEKGRNQFGEYRITYARDFKQVKIVDAQTVNGDGSIEVVRKEEINDMDDPIVSKAPRYPALAIRVVSFPSVDVGDVVEINYEVKCDAHFPFYGGECFQFHDPLLRKEVIVNLPQKAAFHFNQPEGVSFSAKRGNGRTRYEWTAVNKKGIVEERDLPPLTKLAPTLYYSNIPRLKGFISDLEGKMVEKAQVTPEMKKKAAEIVGGSSDDYTRVKRLYDFVAGQVNSIPLGIEAIGGYMSDAATVLRDGYGDGYDKAVLLYGLLQSAGMKPRFVFLLGNSKLQLYAEELKEQSFGAVSRPLVAISLGNQELYLDPVLKDGQYGPLGINQGVDGSLCYLVNGDSLFTRTVAIADSLRNGEHIQTEVQMLSDGGAYMVLRDEHYGVDYALVKKTHRELSPQKLEQYAQKMVDYISRSAVSISGLQTKELPCRFIEAFSCRVPHYGIADGDFLYFDLDKSITESLRGFVELSTKKRYNSYFHGERDGETIDFKVILPRGYRVVLTPGSFERDLPGGLGKISYQRMEGDGSSLSYRLRIDLNEAILSVADYHQLYSIKEEVAGEKYGKVLLKKE